MVVAFLPMNLGQRIKMAREYAGFNKQQDLCDRIRQMFGEADAPKQQAISKLERGESKRSEFTVKIAAACNVSPWWLDSETGPMTLDGKSLTIEIPSVNIGVLEDAISLVLDSAKKHQRRLSHQQQARLVAQLYATTRPDGSLDMGKVLTLITSQGAMERTQGDESEHEGSLKKDSRRSVRGNRKA